MTIPCSPIKLGPVLASPPYTEGEFYSVENRNDSAIEVLIWSHFAKNIAKKTLQKTLEKKTLDNRNIAQCQIENAPAASLVILTFNSSYMENMKTLVTTRRFSHHWHYHCHVHTRCSTQSWSFCISHQKSGVWYLGQQKVIKPKGQTKQATHQLACAPSLSTMHPPWTR